MKDQSIVKGALGGLARFRIGELFRSGREANEIRHRFRGVPCETTRK